MRAVMIATPSPCRSPSLTKGNASRDVAPSLSRASIASSTPTAPGSESEICRARTGSIRARGRGCAGLAPSTCGGPALASCTGRRRTPGMCGRTTVPRETCGEEATDPPADPCEPGEDPLLPITTPQDLRIANMCPTSPSPSVSSRPNWVLAPLTSTSSTSEPKTWRARTGSIRVRGRCRAGLAPSSRWSPAPAPCAGRRRFLPKASDKHRVPRQLASLHVSSSPMDPGVSIPVN
jgi:hypothetical protein